MDKSFSSNKVNLLIIISYVVLSLPLLINHEIWEDEALHWLIPRDVTSIASFFNTMSYQGHPVLWSVVLLPLAKLGLPYEAKVTVHFLIILFAVTIFLWYAPFPKVQKILFIFGYFTFYEYSIIARNYAISVLILFLIAAIYHRRFTSPIQFSFLIFLLGNTNVHSLVIAIVLGAFFAFELRCHAEARISGRYVASCLIVLLGILMAIWQLLPPPDLAEDLASWNFDPIAQIRQMYRAIVGAFLPLPEVKVSFWNTVLALSTKSLVVHPLLGVSIFFVTLVFFRKKLQPLLIYLSSFAGLMAIFALKHDGKIRHHGLVFLVFIFVLWIAQNYKETEFYKGKRLIKLFSERFLSYSLSVIFLIHLIASGVAYYFEINYRFTAGEAVAKFLKENNYVNYDTFIATYQSARVLSILPFLPKPFSKFYYVEYQEYGSFMLWNKVWFSNRYLEINDIVHRIDKAINHQEFNNVLLILTQKVENDPEFSIKYTLISSFENNIVKMHPLYIYRMREHELESRFRASTETRVFSIR